MTEVNTHDDMCWRQMMCFGDRVPVGLDCVCGQLFAQLTVSAVLYTEAGILSPCLQVMYIESSVADLRN